MVSQPTSNHINLLCSAVVLIVVVGIAAGSSVAACCFTSFAFPLPCQPFCRSPGPLILLLLLVYHSFSLVLLVLHHCFFVAAFC